MNRTRSDMRANEIVENIKRHLTASDAMALQADIDEIQNCGLYSDIHADAYNSWNKIKSQAVQVLFRGLPWEQFLNLPHGPRFGKWDVIRGLDEIADEISIEQVMTLCLQWQSLPRDTSAPNLFLKLVQSPDDEVTDWLQQWIDKGSCTLATSGISYSEHAKTMSTFMLQWSPDDGQISNAVSILSRRQDTLARRLKSEYLEWCWAACDPAKITHIELSPGISSAISLFDLENWSSATRGYLSLLIQQRLTGMTPPEGIRRYDRGTVGLIRAFHAVRLEHMSCLHYLVAQCGIAWGYIWILNHAIGRPHGALRTADLLVFVVWLFATGSTCHTHFSGHETLSDHAKMALVLFGSVFFFLVVPIVASLY